MANWTHMDLGKLVAEMTCTIELGKRAGETVVITERMADFPLIAIEKIMRYGFQRVFNDKVGGIDTVEEKVKVARSVIERFKKGDVGRAMGEGVTDLQHEARLIAANLLRTKRPDEWKELKGAEKVVLNKRLDEIVAKFADTINAQAQEKLDEKARERARLAKLSVDIDL